MMVFEDVRKLSTDAVPVLGRFYQNWQTATENNFSAQSWMRFRITGSDLTYVFSQNQPGPAPPTLLSNRSGHFRRKHLSDGNNYQI